MPPPKRGSSRLPALCRQQAALLVQRRRWGQMGASRQVFHGWKSAAGAPCRAPDESTPARDAARLPGVLLPEDPERCKEEEKSESMKRCWQAKPQRGGQV